MRPAQLARLLIEGPSIVVEDTSGEGDGGGSNAISRGISLSNPVRHKAGTDHGSLDQKEGNGHDEKLTVDKKISVYLNRLALRIFSVPSFSTYWKDTVLVKDDEAKDGHCRIQLVFHRLPDEVLPMLTRLLAAPRAPKYTRFTDRGQARTGVELEVSPDDFGGDDYDYAF